MGMFPGEGGMSAFLAAEKEKKEKAGIRDELGHNLIITESS